MDIRIRLGDFLETHNLPTARLVEQAKGKAAKNTVYSLVRGDVKRVDLDTLSTVMTALEEITGQSVTFADILERVEPRQPGMSAAGVPYTGDPETDAVLDDHPDILERIRKLERGESKLIPIEEVAAQLGIKL